MRRFLNGLILGLVLGALAYWFIEYKSRQHPEAEQRFQEAAAQAKTNAGATAGNLSDALKAKLDAMDLRADEIKEELAKTGKVFRRKASDFGAEVADAAADARIVAAIKSSYAVDPNLSVWKISVSCTQGHVTLSGTVSAPDDVGRAIALAMDIKGVRDVSSTLQVSNSPP